MEHLASDGTHSRRRRAAPAGGRGGPLRSSGGASTLTGVLPVARPGLAVFGVFLLGLAAGLLVGRGLSAPAHRVLALVFVGLGVLLVLDGLGVWPAI